MAEQVLWTVSLRAVNGPQINTSGNFQVEAYDKVDVTIAAGGNQQVDLFPGAAGALRCLVIVPALPDEQLTYDVGGTAVALDAPHVLLGGAVGLAGDATSLTFDNQTAVDATISIFVGRDATP